MMLGREPEPFGDAGAGTAPAHLLGVTPRSLLSSSSSSGSRQMGSPSRRQKQLSDQRGNCSPGYHLPWPKCDRPCGAYFSLSRS